MEDQTAEENTLPQYYLAVMSAAAGAAAVMSAAMPAVAMLMVVMVAANVGVIAQFACQQGIDRSVCIAPNAAVEPNARTRKGQLSAAADAAADQNLHALGCQKVCQRSMSAASGGLHLGAYDGIVCDLIKLKISRMAKVLKDIFTVVGYCDFHGFLLSVELFNVKGQERDHS